MQRSFLWAEDLEGHRQPSLYYLDGDEGVDGPHLICDWNGAPTDVDEFNIDVLSLLKEQPNEDADDDEEEFFDAHSEPTTDKQTSQSKEDDDDKQEETDSYIDYPNPAANMTKSSKSRINMANGIPVPIRQNDLIVDDCDHLDFLSVPPVSSGLLKRIVRNLNRMQANSGPGAGPSQRQGV